MFGSLVTAQMLHAITCRSATGSVFGSERLPPNPVLSRILFGSAVAQSAALLVPGIRNLLGVGPIGAADALVTLAGGVMPFALAETLKLHRGPAGPRTDPLHFSRRDSVRQIPPNEGGISAVQKTSGSQNP